MSHLLDVKQNFDKSKRKVLGLLSAGVAWNVIASTASVAPAALAAGNKDKSNNDSYQGRLYTPTQIVKLYGLYFIVDCWHHRILYTRHIDQPISKWKLLDDQIAGPHSIASNGHFYVAEDTGRHGLRVYTRMPSDQFQLHQVIPHVGKRPHRVLYDAKRQQFLTVGSTDQSIHIHVEKNNRLVEVFQKKVMELNDQYCRSITVKNNSIYFVGVSQILEFELQQNAIGKLKSQLDLNSKYKTLGGAIDLFFLNNASGYLTLNPKNMLSFQHLSDLEKGTAKDLSANFKGVPYYMEVFDGKLWLPEPGQDAINYSKKYNLNTIVYERLFNFGLAGQASLKRKSVFPL